METSTNAFDYGAEAELFTGQRGYSKHCVRYQRFALASRATVPQLKAC